MSSNLITLIRQESSREPPDGVRALVEVLLNRYGAVTQAILFYGSCFRTGDDSDGLVDLYVIVDSYRAALPNRIQAIANKLLPPNVFYLELPVEERVVRTKYAVLSLKDFQRGTSKQWFHSYLWGRFAQPAGLLYVRNNQVEKQVRMALARAVITFMTRVMPDVEERFSARDLWRHGLLLSSRAELRSEKPEKLVEYAIFTSQVMESCKELSDLFNLGNLKTIFIEGNSLKVLNVIIEENKINIFMDKKVNHKKIIQKLSL